MDEKTRDKIIASFEEAIHTVGGSSYDDGIEAVAQFFQLMQDKLDAIRTRDKLRELLDSLPPLSDDETAMALSVVSQLPQLIRTGLTMLGEEAIQTLPAFNAGRPRVMHAKQIEEALDFISALQRQGVSLQIAKQRAARKYGCGLRTIARYWASRSEMARDAPTLDEIKRFLAEG